MTSLPWLDPDQLWFPPANEALDDPDGLLALGGDLSTERLILAYRNGIFPWYSDDQPILWWSPNPRCVLFPNEIHVSRSLRRTLNQQRFQVTADRHFGRIIRLCASTRAEGTWITEEMIASYSELHRRGVAHSIEIWNQRGELAGVSSVNPCFLWKPTRPKFSWFTWRTSYSSGATGSWIAR